MSPATLEEPIKSTVPAYIMPKAYKGQMVLWYEGGVNSDSSACAAIVTQVDVRSLWLHIFKADSSAARIRTCVRHMNDPHAREAERVDEGGWDYCENGIDRPSR